MSPPALIIPGQIPISTPLTRLLKVSLHDYVPLPPPPPATVVSQTVLYVVQITNSSLADICYHWSSVEGSNVTVSVEPVQGKISKLVHLQFFFNGMLMLHNNGCEDTILLERGFFFS